MACAPGGCSSGGCGFKGVSQSGGGSASVTGSGDRAAGDGGADTREVTYRDVVSVRIGFHSRPFYCDSTGFLLLMGDFCVVESDSGEAFAVAVQSTSPSREFSGVTDMSRVLRRARPEDIEVNERNLAVRRESIDYCRARIVELNLEMKLVNVEPTFDERKITFLFTAEERVDFRELVRDLAQRFRRRIEMRQIGARDEAKIVGGQGICGRPLCCSTFLEEFAPISVKMAKRQGLSLNPSKISGLCGRLMCCLRYEDADADQRAAKKGEGNGGEGQSPTAPDQPPSPASPPPDPPSRARPESTR